MARLELVGLGKSFGPTPVLHRIDLALDDGELLVVVGASGCGKSTLLRLVAGLETPSAGRVVLDGRDITGLDPAARDIAMVFQNYALYPHMSVFDNMAYGLRVRGLGREEIRRRVGEAAATLGLEALLARRPAQLSGGQRQRVAMGRAIVREPKLFLFDEPLSNLDAKLRVQMRAEILRLQRRMGVTSLYVTHDQVEAMTLGDRLLVLNEGRPAQLAPPMEVFARPADTYVASFIGAPSMNLIPTTLASNGTAIVLTGGITLPLAGRYPGGDGRPVTAGIRPDHLRHATRGDDDGVPLTVELVERLGSESLVHGSIPGNENLVARLPGLPAPQRTIRLGIPPEHLHLFDAGTGQRIEPIEPATDAKHLAGVQLGR